MRLSSSMIRKSASLRMSTTVAASSSPYHPKRPRRFAPLDPAKPNEHDAAKLRGIIFDVDGTLCLPQSYMFGEMRAALGIDKSIDILDHIRSLSDEPDQTPTYSAEPSSPQSRAHEAIRSIERRAMTSQRAQPGLVQLMSYLTSRQIPKALCTRNFPAPVHHLLGKFLPKEKFGPIITRETIGIAPKPSPEGLWKVARSWSQGEGTRNLEQAMADDTDPLEMARRVLGDGLIMVGDSLDDVAAGYRAGAATVLLVNDENEALSKHEYTDLSIRSLDELISVLDEGFVGKA